MRARVALSVALLGSSLSVLSTIGSSTAYAQTTEPHEFAAQEHQAAQQAAGAKDWPTAAAHLENAFFAVPTAQELRAAVYARLQAKQYARAATLAALGMRKYENDPKTMKQATDAIRDARPHVFALTVTCASECGVVADEKVVTVERAKAVELFLDPGKHELLVSWADGSSKTVDVDAKEGARDTLAIEPPPKRAAPPPPTPSPPATPAPPPAAAIAATSSTAPSPDAAAQPARKPLGPALFFVGAGLTLVAAGVTVWSGLDAQKNPGKDAVLRDCVGLGESCPTYQQGRDAQLRTNVLIGVSSGLAVATAVVGVLFTQWSKPVGATRARASIEPQIGVGSLGLAGRF